MGPAPGHPDAFAGPVYDRDFPDPTILVADGAYWAYATGSAGSNLQVMISPDLRRWTAPVDPLPVLPAWAATGLTWAPGVMAIQGRFVMYYTVRHARLGMQCISVAASPTPQGPYSDTRAEPLICQTAAGGSIDPNPYLDPVSGGLYLLWKSDDNALGRRARIWGQQLAGDGLSLAPDTTPALLLTQNARWQSLTVEGPTVIGDRSGYHLFYGANDYSTAGSAIGHATSPTLLGGYTNRSTRRPWLGSTGRARGPQGPMVFTDLSGRTRLAFAAWYGPVGYRRGGVRSLWIATLGFTEAGQPRLA